MPATVGQRFEENPLLVRAFAPSINQVEVMGRDALPYSVPSSALLPSLCNYSEAPSSAYVLNSLNSGSLI